MAKTRASAADYLRKKFKRGNDKDETLWALLDAENKVGMELRRQFEQVWILHLAFLQSKQYVMFNATAHELKALRRNKGERRVVDNQLLPKWRRQVADLIKNDPEMSVTPNSHEERDLQAARVGDKALKGWWRSKLMRSVIRRMAPWLYGTGNVFLEDIWDRGAGPVQQTPEGLVYEGDVGVNLWTPFDVVAPAFGLFVGGIDDLPWLELAKWRSFGWMKNFLPEQKKKINKIAPETSPEQDNLTGGLFGKPGTQTRTSMASIGAFFREFRIQPCDEFPKGLRTFASNGTILMREDFPYTEYSITHLKDIEMPGQFWGGVTGEHGIQLQNRWNRTLNSVDSFNETMAKGKWLAPEGANLTSDPNNKHGEVLTYRAQLGMKPEHISVKGLPPTLDFVLASTQRSLENLYSQHEVTRGTNKSDIRSGEMLTILREQDAHGNIPSHMNLEEGLESFCSRVLKRMQSGYKSPRLVKIVGQDSQWEVFQFKGADLNGNTDVAVKRQSSMPDSRMAREARIMERYEKGLYGDPAHPETRRQVMNMIKDNAVDLSFKSTRLDETVAKNEAMLLFTLEVDEILPNVYDNHGIHVREFDDFRKSYEYQKLKYEDPKRFMMLEGRFQQHTQLHQKFIDEQQKKMIAAQRAMKGGGK